MSLWSVALILFADLLCVLYAVYMIYELVYSVKRHPPFIRTRNSVVHEVLGLLKPIPAESVFYDLGCGDARVLRALREKYPDAQYVGIDLRLLPYAMAKFKTRNMPNVTILRKNIFSHDISDATHIYTFLYPKVMDDLLPKFTRELTVGTKVYSLDFFFTQKKPLQKHILTNTSFDGLGRTLYGYEF
jgi:SAM-dependent methyltransferase